MTRITGPRSPFNRINNDAVVGNLEGRNEVDQSENRVFAFDKRSHRVGKPRPLSQAGVGRGHQYWRGKPVTRTIVMRYMCLQYSELLI